MKRGGGGGGFGCGGGGSGSRHLQRGDQLAVLLQLDPLLGGEVVADQDASVRPRRSRTPSTRRAQLDPGLPPCRAPRGAAEAHLDAPLAREERRRSTSFEDESAQSVQNPALPPPGFEERLERRRRVREPRVVHALGGPRRQPARGRRRRRCSAATFAFGPEALLLGDAEELTIACRSVPAPKKRPQNSFDVTCRWRAARGAALELLGAIDRALQVGGSGEGRWRCG